MRIPTELESEKLEYKRELPRPDKLAREFIAFANTRGGQIVIGYDEKTASFKDFPPNQRTEELIANVVSDYCQPRIPYTLAYETQSDLPSCPTVLIIHVPEGLSKPYSLKNTPLEEGVFVRVGSTSRKADRDELARLIRAGQNISYDREEVRGSYSLDPALVKKFLERRNAAHGAQIEPIQEELLEDLGVMTRNGLPTVAGILLFCRRPQDVPGFEHAYIQLARFKGLEKGYFIDRQEIYGPVSEQLEDAKKFIIKNIRISGAISGVRRNDKLEYPENIIREVLVNALVHRDYSRRGSSISVAIFDDRIEVTSPGGLEGGVSPANIQHRQYSRNPIIARRMFDMGYFDSWGQGIDNIMKWSKDTGVSPPLFVDEPDQFALTIFSGFESQSQMPKKAESLMTKRDTKLLQQISGHDSFTNQTIRENFGLTKGQAQSFIQRLLEAGHITRSGSGKSTFYTVVKS